MGMSLQGVEAYLREKVDPNFRFVDNRDAEVPFAKLDKPVKEAKVALISSGGFYWKEDPAFDAEDPRGDASFRKIALGSTLEELRIAHTHYDHQYVEADLNCAMPMELLEKMADEGQIGEIAETHYSFMWAMLKTDELMEEYVPQVAELLKDDGVDVAILAPTWPLCNQSVGLIARVLEEAGIVTVTLNMFPEVAEQVRPPRTVQTKMVFGAPFGDPGNEELQRKVLETCLQLLEKAETPGQVEILPYKWKQKF